METSSTYFNFDKEINFLQDYFEKNSFPSHFFYNIVKLLLDKKVSEIITEVDCTERSTIHLATIYGTSYFWH